MYIASNIQPELGNFNSEQEAKWLDWLRNSPKDPNIKYINIGVMGNPDCSSADKTKEEFHRLYETLLPIVQWYWDQPEQFGNFKLILPNDTDGSYFAAKLMCSFWGWPEPEVDPKFLNNIEHLIKFNKEPQTYKFSYKKTTVIGEGK